MNAPPANAINPLQAFYKRAIDREELAFEPTEEIDIPVGSSKRPRRIVSPAEVAEPHPRRSRRGSGDMGDGRYAGLRRGELQALRCMDVDLATNLIQVRKGWDQVEGEIAPKSEASKRTIPVLAVLHDHLAKQLLGTGRSRENQIFGRSSGVAFYASTIDGRAKRAWRAHNSAERKRPRRRGASLSY